MNRIYSIVWNSVSACWQATAESARSHGKPGTTRAQTLLGTAILGALLGASPAALAGPTGGQVTAGSATINQSGSKTTINQSSQNAAINWQSFSVGKSESVQFNQPNASSITLNRVTGTESSQILGSLTANGHIFILNPNGVLFGKDAQVNVGGIVASTGRMSDADFMAGNYKITGATQGSVINEGNIQTGEGGVIAFIAPLVQNTGTLKAPQGNVLLAGAEAVTLNLQDGSLIGYTLDKGSLQAMVDNGGLIQADGGHVVLTAKGLDALSKATVNHSGIIEAHTVANKNGVVELLGDMEVGQVNLSGKIDASAPNGGNGGFVETSARDVRVNENATVNTLATSGSTGMWLIDPNDFIVAASGGNMTGAFLSSRLATTMIMIDTRSMGTAGGNGDIFINDSVSWSSSNPLLLYAERNIEINRPISATHTNSDLTLFAGLGGQSGSSVAINAPLSVSGFVRFYGAPAAHVTVRQNSAGKVTTNRLYADGNVSVLLDSVDNSIGVVEAAITGSIFIVNGSRDLIVGGSGWLNGVDAANVGLVTGGDLVINERVKAFYSGDINVGPTWTRDTLCLSGCIRPHVLLEAPTGRFVNNVGSNAISVPAGKYWALIASMPSNVTLNGLAPSNITYDASRIYGDILLSANRVFYFKQPMNGSVSESNSAVDSAITGTRNSNSWSVSNNKNPAISNILTTLDLSGSSSNSQYFIGKHTWAGSYGYLIDGYQVAQRSDGGERISFPVYNNRSIYAAVEVFDENGSLVDYQLIDPKKLETSIGGFYVDLIGGAIDPNSGFKNSSISTETDVSVVVPKGGAIKVSYSSQKALAANLLDSGIDLLSQFIDIDIPLKGTAYKVAFNNLIAELLKSGFTDLITDISLGKINSFGDFGGSLVNLVFSTDAAANAFDALFSAGGASVPGGKNGATTLLKKWLGKSTGAAITSMIDGGAIVLSGLNLGDAVRAPLQDQSLYDLAIQPSWK